MRYFNCARATEDSEIHRLSLPFDWLYFYMIFYFAFISDPVYH